MAKKKIEIIEEEKIINLNFISLIISILLVSAAILINKSTAIRPIMWLIGIILFAINLSRRNNWKKINTIFFILVVLVMSIISDGILVYSFKRIPVFTYNIVSKDNTIVYHSLGMRVWQCNKDNTDDLIVDAFYTKGYMCNAEDIEVIDSNTFFNSVVSNYSDYRNNYVKIRGKISKKSGLNYIEMQPYSTTSITLNGYVEFSDSITLRILFDEKTTSLEKYDLYDEITVIGVIKNLETSGNKHTIYMYESEVLSELNLTEYIITITSANKCIAEPTLLHSNEKSDIYTYCISEATITYPDNVYELAHALSSNKITIEEIYAGSLSEEKNKENNNTIYHFDEYSVLVCDQNASKDIYIGPSNLSFNSVDCKVKVEE